MTIVCTCLSVSGDLYPSLWPIVAYSGPLSKGREGTLAACTIKMMELGMCLHREGKHEFELPILHLQNTE